ncbi:MAG: hypothetical protein AAGI30_13810 [Planctomycetota bacterium]
MNEEQHEDVTVGVAPVGQEAELTADMTPATMSPVMGPLVMLIHLVFVIAVVVIATRNGVFIRRPVASPLMALLALFLPLLGPLAFLPLALHRKPAN